MLILHAALVAILATRGTGVKPSSPTAPSALATLSGNELARALKTDFESIAGPGTVEVRIDEDTLFSIRIAMANFSPEVCTRLYDRELELYGLFPGLNFDFHFDGPKLARALKTEIESISGLGTVDVSIDSKTLFNFRIAVPGSGSKVYNQLYDRELELYKLFPDLSFDFYLRLKPEHSADARAPGQ